MAEQAPIYQWRKPIQFRSTLSEKQWFHDMTKISLLWWKYSSLFHRGGLPTSELGSRPLTQQGHRVTSCNNFMWVIHFASFQLAELMDLFYTSLEARISKFNVVCLDTVNDDFMVFTREPEKSSKFVIIIYVINWRFVFCRSG